MDKKFLAIIFSISFLFTSCKKDETITSPGSNSNPAGKIFFQYIELDSRIINIEAIYSIDLSNLELPIRPLILGRHTFCVSPNGNTIAYVEDPPDYVLGLSNHEIFTMSIDGTNKVLLKQFFCRQIYSLDWSPDSKKLVFDYYVYRWSICSINSDGTVFRSITDSTNSFTGAIAPRWSPNGNSIACETWNDATLAQLSRPDSLGILSPNGTGYRVLAQSSRGYFPQWSQDGKKIAFSMVNAYYGGLYIVDINSSAIPVEISPPAGQILFAYSLQWLPDNRLVCVGRNLNDSTYSINIVPANSSSGVKQIANGFKAAEVLYSSPSVLCSSDGQKVVVLGSRGNDTFSLYIMRPDGSDFQRVKILSNSSTASALPGICRWVQ